MGNRIWIGGARDGEEGDAVVEEIAVAKLEAVRAAQGDGGGATVGPGDGLASAVAALPKNRVRVWGFWEIRYRRL
jgi:hypothetical protein